MIELIQIIIFKVIRDIIKIMTMMIGGLYSASEVWRPSYCKIAANAFAVDVGPSKFRSHQRTFLKCLVTHRKGGRPVSRLLLVSVATPRVFSPDLGFFDPT